MVSHDSWPWVLQRWEGFVPLADTAGGAAAGQRTQIAHRLLLGRTLALLGGGSGEQATAPAAGAAGAASPQWGPGGAAVLQGATTEDVASLEAAQQLFMRLLQVRPGPPLASNTSMHMALMCYSLLC